MTTHITVRLAWHNDGWNGRICEKPAENTYCVGCHSYPGEMIREQRDIVWEKEHAGDLIADLEQQPPCMYSASAFADTGSELFAEPPEFFNDDTKIARWSIPPATACTWPYEAMYYKPDLKLSNGRYDYGKRLEYAEEHFSALENDKSLIFYYANYSNPLSEDNDPKYVLVGVSRLKTTDNTHYYPECSQQTLDRYKGFVWQRNVSSHYPDQGLRLPFHLYRNQPEILEKFVVVPETTPLFKYASKHANDDYSIELLEQLLESVRILRDEICDKSENWNVRINWLNGVIAELWKNRGAYPGMPAVLEFIGLNEAIDAFKAQVLAGKEKEAVEQIKNFTMGQGDSIGKFKPVTYLRNRIVRNIQLSAGESLDLLLNTLSRCALTTSQLKKILSDNKSDWGISANFDQIKVNPYLLAEQFNAGDEDDPISWSTIDRGVIPSPELGVENLLEIKSAERIRALLLEQIRRNSQHTFIDVDTLFKQLENRISVQPEWKRSPVSMAHLKVDKAFLQETIYFREETGVLYLYDRLVWDDERLISSHLSDLISMPDIRFTNPLPRDFWERALFVENSSLAENAREEYQQAIVGQKEACSRIIHKHLAVLDGGAGTGKSTVVSAIIKAVNKIRSNEGIAILAPTGKATDRLRSMLLKDKNTQGVHTATIHSLLAQHGWLNSNMMFRRHGGNLIDKFSTIIIDESSMIDLTLMAALFRAVNWNVVQRLILVGDPAQLPPIGIGKVFADLIQYIREHSPQNIASLKDNLRQLENRVNGRGTGILTLAGCFRNKISDQDLNHNQTKFIREELVQKIHQGGAVDSDLDVVFWRNAEELGDLLIEKISNDIVTDGAETETKSATHWSNVLKNNINAFQILSPVRGELYGVDHINQVCQKFKSKYWLDRGSVDGITLFDKVIQIRNRPASNPIKAYDFNKRDVVDVEIYNGELGIIEPCKWPKNAKEWGNLAVKDLCGKFHNKQHLKINYFGHTENKPQNNLELGYAISVHKSQGSEFDRVYFVLPRVSPYRQMMELLYTGLTRASTHCTVFIQDSVETLLSHMRPERSALTTINTSLFSFRAVPVELLRRDGWYEEGKVHKSLTGDMVRSKSEVIIANMLHQKDISFVYESPLYADDSTMHLPDFTIKWKGETYYWEHLGMLDDQGYAKKWSQKEQWYKDHSFHQQLIVSKDEKGNLDSQEIERIINRRIFGIDEIEQRRSWNEIAELASSELIKDFVVAAKQKGLTLPVWGYEIVIEDEIRGSVEFAWPDKKIAVTSASDDLASAELLEKNDWTLFCIDQLAANTLVNVIKAFVS